MCACVPRTGMKNTAVSSKLLLWCKGAPGALLEGTHSYRVSPTSKFIIVLLPFEERVLHHLPLCACVYRVCVITRHTYKYNELHSLGKHNSTDAHTHTEDIETLSGMSPRVCLVCRMMESLNCGGPVCSPLLHSQDKHTHTHIHWHCAPTHFITPLHTHVHHCVRTC